MNKEEEKKNLIHRSIMGGFDLSFIDKFIELKSKYSDDSQLQRECSYWIATIYAENNLLEEAVNIYRQLIPEKEKMPLQFPNILIHTLQLLRELKRLEEAHELFAAHILGHELSSFSYTLPLLSWYVETFKTSNLDLAKYEHLLNSAMEQLDFHSKERELDRKIMDVTHVNATTSKKYSKILISLDGKSKDDKIQIIETFIESDPPGFYIGLAEDMLYKLKK